MFEVRDNYNSSRFIIQHIIINEHSALSVGLGFDFYLDFCLGTTTTRMSSKQTNKTDLEESGGTERERESTTRVQKDGCKRDGTIFGCCHFGCSGDLLLLFCPTAKNIRTTLSVQGPATTSQFNP